MKMKTRILTLNSFSYIIYLEIEIDWKVGDDMDRTKQSLNVFVGMNRALDTLEQITKEDVKRYGLNITEFAVLELLYNKGPQPIQRIRDRVLIASSRISDVVSQLEDKG